MKSEILLPWNIADHPQVHYLSTTPSPSSPDSNQSAKAAMPRREEHAAMPSGSGTSFWNLAIDRLSVDAGNCLHTSLPPKTELKSKGDDTAGQIPGGTPAPGRACARAGCREWGGLPELAALLSIHRTRHSPLAPTAAPPQWNLFTHLGRWEVLGFPRFLAPTCPLQITKE